MSTATTIMNRLRAESLLEGSHILTQIQDLKQGLNYQTDDQYISFDEHFLRMQDAIDKIPGIKLQDSIPAQQGAAYENELITSLEMIQDQVERYKIKVIRFQGDLTRAKANVDELAIAFESWYFVAAVELMSTTDLPKLPNANLKALATTEFSRLMERSNLTLDTLIEAVKIEIKRLDSKSKMGRQKFEMGREQVNASWANRLPESLGYSPDAPSFDLLKRDVLEEDLDEIPAFVSKSGEIKGMKPVPEFDDSEFDDVPEPPPAPDAATIMNSDRPGNEETPVERVIEYDETVLEAEELDSRVSEASYSKLPGHDGLETLPAVRSEGIEAVEPTPDALDPPDETASAAPEPPVIQGNFRKIGDPAPVTVIGESEQPVTQGRGFFDDFDDEPAANSVVAPADDLDDFDDAPEVPSGVTAEIVDVAAYATPVIEEKPEPTQSPRKTTKVLPNFDFDDDELG